MLVQGGPNSLRVVVEHFRNNCPVVLVPESKGCSRALTDFTRDLQRTAQGAAVDWEAQLRNQLCDRRGLNPPRTGVVCATECFPCGPTRL